MGRVVCKMTFNPAIHLRICPVCLETNQITLVENSWYSETMKEAGVSRRFTCPVCFLKSQKTYPEEDCPTVIDLLEVFAALLSVQPGQLLEWCQARNHQKKQS